MKRIKNGGDGGEIEDASAKDHNAKNHGNEKANAGVRDCSNDVDVDNRVDPDAHNDDMYNGNGGAVKLDDNKNGGAHAAR